jgi:hypothetical protein
LAEFYGDDDNWEENQEYKDQKHIIKHDDQDTYGNLLIDPDSWSLGGKRARAFIAKHLTGGEGSE